MSEMESETETEPHEMLMNDAKSLLAELRQARHGEARARLDAVEDIAERAISSLGPAAIAIQVAREGEQNAAARAIRAEGKLDDIKLDAGELRVLRERMPVMAAEAGDLRRSIDTLEARALALTLANQGHVAQLQKLERKAYNTRREVRALRALVEIQANLLNARGDR